MVRFEVVRGDIAALDVDAVVNAANESLLGGGGVDGAIPRAAGPGLLAECRSLGGCAPGDAKATGGHGLRARAVVHAVGPVWRGGDRGEAGVLASAYRRSVEEAIRLGCRSIAFPSISTGAYGYPPEQAAVIAVAAVQAAVGPPLERVTFCTFSEADRSRYQRLLTGGP